MKRKEFLRILRDELRKHRNIDTEEVLFYYDELIQDAVENGEDEEIFILNLGSVKDIVRRMEDDETFVAEVKQRNSDIVSNVLSLTVKLVGYAVFGLGTFILGSIIFSIFVSGISVFGAGFVKAILSGPYDLYGYLALAGVVLVGLSLIILSVAILKWYINQAKPVLLSIFRNTKKLFDRKEK